MKTLEILLCCIILVFGPAIAQSNDMDVFEAAKEGDLNTVQAILATNASMLNAQDKDGDTALIWAVRRNQTNVAKSLLLKGVDPSITNKNGISAIQLANALGESEGLGFLKKTEISTVITNREPINISSGEPTNEVLSLSAGTGILRQFDINGIVLEGNNIYLPRIPLYSLNSDELKALLKCKMAYNALTMFGHYDQYSDSGLGNYFATKMNQIWSNGKSLLDRIKTRLKIFDEMREYNKDTALYLQYKKTWMSLSDQFGKKWDYVSSHAETQQQSEMISGMMINDPMHAKMDNAANQQSLIGSKIDSVSARLSGDGISVPGVPTDPIQDLPYSSPFVIIPPFQCEIN